jgi:SPX domain protein involved in polyphosphate accumulation|tara:strand:- start:110 stop:784 length:675 start_codon:yes stop_codon:yes gene_type:complete
MLTKINRYERKWIYRSNDHLTLINSLIRSNLFFNKQYPNRRVNSIYFDDINYSSIRQNLDGISEKKKIRVRWYGAQNQLVNPVLEIKNKKGLETRKETYKISELDGLKFPDFKNLDLIKNTVNLQKKSKNTILPILTTNYDRQYFVSNNGKIRATIDYNLKSIHLKNPSQMEIVKIFSSTCILEIKYPTNLDKYVRLNLKEITLRLSKNSKYINSAFNLPSYYS